MRGVAKSSDLHESYMSKARNILISFGVFWLSLWVAPLVGWPLDKLPSRITYTHDLQRVCIGCHQLLGPDVRCHSGRSIGDADGELVSSPNFGRLLSLSYIFSMRHGFIR